MTNDEREIKRKLRVLKRADELGNASKAYRYFGVSKSTFYRWREGTESGQHYIELYVRNPAGRPMIRTANIVDPDGETQALKFRTFDKTTTLRGVLNKSSATEPDNLTVTIEFMSGTTLEFPISSKANASKL